MTEILLVDDDATIRRALKAFLESEGFLIREARNGALALSALQSKLSDLILLDCDMPKMNGFAACVEIRKLGIETPIIFLSSSSSDCDQVRALAEGADDFVKKTESKAILLARIRLALSRHMPLSSEKTADTAVSTESAAGAADSPRSMQLGETLINFDQLFIKDPQHEVHLTRTEAQFLRLLYSRHGEVVTYNEAFDILRGQGYIGDERALHVHISRLRHKLGDLAACIQNERATGYSWCGPTSSNSL